MGYAIVRAVYRQTGVVSVHSVMSCSVSDCVPLKSDPIQHGSSDCNSCFLGHCRNERPSRERPTHSSLEKDDYLKPLQC